MKEDTLQTIQFDKFQALLKELLNDGYGEIQYKIVVQGGKIQFISLTKTNTFKSEMIQ